MKIKELSIGDWVATPDGNIGYIAGLSTYTAAGCAAEVIEKGEGTMSKWECLQLHPIPLTPEILEKNGCLHTAENRILCDWFDGRITVRKYNNREWYELFVGSNQMKFKLMFVHQLQRALRLAGIEKEIEV